MEPQGCRTVTDFSTTSCVATGATSRADHLEGQHEKSCAISDPDLYFWLVKTMFWKVHQRNFNLKPDRPNFLGATSVSLTGSFTYCGVFNLLHDLGYPFKRQVWRCLGHEASWGPDDPISKACPKWLIPPMEILIPREAENFGVAPILRFETGRCDLWLQKRDWLQMLTGIENLQRGELVLS